MITRVVDPLCRFVIIAWLGPENIRHEGLGVPVVQRKPTGLNLLHHSMSGEKDVVRRW